MRFIYHPDNTVYVNSTHLSFEEFMLNNPDFPLTEGQYFSYINGIFTTINSEGHNFPQDDVTPYQDIIYEIEAL